MDKTPSHKPFSIVVLLTGQGTNLEAIMNKIQSEAMNLRIAAVVSNKKHAGGLCKARAAGIPAIALTRGDYPDRVQYDRALKAQVQHYDPDLVVLAGFLHVLGAEFVDHYYGRLINLHPSLLPKHKGLNAHKKAMDSGDSWHGATVHFVNRELDEGPIIAQSACPITPEDTLEQVQKKVLQLEHAMFPEVIQWIATGRLVLNDQNQVVLDGQILGKTGFQFPR